MNDRAGSGSLQNHGTCRSGHRDQIDNSVLSETGSNLALDSHELDPIEGCTGDDYVSHPPLLREVECSAGVYLRVVSVMERLAASPDIRPLIRLTLSGMCVNENVSASASDSHPHGSGRKNESECVKEVESEGDCVGVLY